MNTQGHLAVLADSDLFGFLTIACLLTAISGLFNGIRNSKVHRLLTFTCLMAIPGLRAVGAFFLNQAPA
jgi:hypothetical protein